MKPVPEMLMGRTGANLQVQGSNPNQPLQHPASAMAPGDALPGRTPAMAVGSTEEPARLQIEEAIICPRCTSINTKFCYYNNYSLHQPRYFCKTCRRYWTQGGSLRDVPVGGGSRKNKLSPPSLLASASGSDSSSMAGQAVSYTNPNLVHDMNLAEYRPFPSLEGSNMCNPAGGATMGARAEKALSAMELLRSIGGDMPVQVPMQVVLGEFRAQPQPQSRSPSCLVGLSLDPNGSGGVASSEGYGTSAWMQCMQDRTGKLVFPFQDLRQPARSGAGGGESGGGSCAGANGGHHHQLEKGKNE